MAFANMPRCTKAAVALILTAAFVIACTPASVPTVSPTAPVVLVKTPTVLSSTVTPSTAPPMLADTPSSVEPTTLPPTPAPAETAIDDPPATVPLTETAVSEPDPNGAEEVDANMINITIGERVLSARLVENSSTVAMKEALAQGAITIDMRDYGSMEKVGPLGLNLPRNDEPITTEAGDMILYQGNRFVMYYAPNTWTFTRLGTVTDVTAEELKEILGEGNITVTLSLP